MNVPKTGTPIRIQSETKGGFTQIEVRPSKVALDYHGTTRRAG